MDDDAVKVQYRLGQQLLELGCGSSAFTRIKEVVRIEASLADAEVGPTSTIVIIDLGNKPPRPTRFRDIVGGVGCALICCLLLGVLGIGIHTIWRWLSGVN